MKETSELTFIATIYIGFKDRDTGHNIGSMRKTRKICQQFTNDVSYCVTISPIEYRYYNGSEKGAVIGLINYPRFPQQNFQTKIYAKQLAEKLMIAFNQYRVSIVMSDETIMLSKNNNYGILATKTKAVSATVPKNTSV